MFQNIQSPKLREILMQSFLTKAPEQPMIAPDPVYGPQPNPATSPGGLNAELARRLNLLFQAAPGAQGITSGFRSVQRQQELWDQAVRKYGSAAAARKWVAPPGKSRHNSGNAADISGHGAITNALLKQFGLYRPMSYEPWHIELIGSR